MREIKFRGRRLGTGDWVYGDLQSQAIPLAAILTYDQCEGYGDIIPVTPRTVWQYTGLEDVDGVPIYEGDIVESRDEKGEGKRIIGEIVWCESVAAFIGVHAEGQGWLNEGDPTKPTRLSYTRVIGNKYQNPEL